MLTDWRFGSWYRLSWTNWISLWLKSPRNKWNPQDLINLTCFHVWVSETRNLPPNWNFSGQKLEFWEHFKLSRFVELCNVCGIVLKQFSDTLTSFEISGESSVSFFLEMFSSWIVSFTIGRRITFFGRKAYFSFPFLDKSILVRVSLVSVTAIFLLLRSL